MKFLLLEDGEGRVLEMSRAVRVLFPGIEIVHFAEASVAIEWLRRNVSSLDWLSLDHDLGRISIDTGGDRYAGTGLDVVEALVMMHAKRPVIVHSANDTAARGMLHVLQSAGWTASRVEPCNGLEWVETAWLPECSRMLER